MITRTICIAVLPENDPIFSERATTIRIDDEAAGEFVIIEQTLGDRNKIRIDPDEWPTIRGAIDKMIGECK